jgi:transcriptional regulator with XRE-family HTH domain
MEEDAVRREFGRRIRRRRMALGLTQRELAARIDMLPTQLSRLEAGEYRAVNIARLAQIADALHTSLDYLLSRTDDAGEIPERVIVPLAS